MIKTLKLNKKHLSDPLHLLLSIGAKSETKNEVFPWKVFMNAKDYKKMEKLLTLKYKKSNPYSNLKRIKAAVGLQLLNYGPVEVKTGIQEGYAIYVQE